MLATEAKELLRGHFFGIEEATKWFGVRATDAQREMLRNVPFAREELAALVGQGTLIATFPVTVLEMRTRFPEFFVRQNPAADPYDFELESAAQPSWHFVYHEPRPETARKTFRAQTAAVLLDGLPEVHVVVAAMLGQFLNTREHLFVPPRATLRTLTAVGDEEVATVAYAQEDGETRIRVGTIADSVATSLLYLARNYPM